MDDQPTLEDVNELRDDIMKQLGFLADRAKKYGFNVAIVIHSYDPLTGESTYGVDIFGDPFALQSVMRKYIDS